MRIRNTTNPSNLGTMISQNPVTDLRNRQIDSAIRQTGLIDVGGTAMANAPGTAAKIFDVLAKKDIKYYDFTESFRSSISMV